MVQQIQRRQRGSDSIYRRNNGVWVATIELTRSEQKRNRKSFTGKTFCGLLKTYSEFRKERPPRKVYRPVTRNRKTDMVVARVLGTHTEAEWYAKIRASNARCAYCGRFCPTFVLEKDHVIPISRGGSDGIENVVVACYPCNRGKSDLTVEEWRSIGSPVVNLRKGRFIHVRTQERI